jgi:hypothetical protein
MGYVTIEHVVELSADGDREVEVVVVAKVADECGARLQMHDDTQLSGQLRALMEPVPQLLLWVRGVIVDEGRRRQRLVHDC